jgi:hypothetical protein
MTRRPALLSQADVARAIRAARQTGAEAVEVQQGKITILLKAPTIAPSDDPFENWEREHEQAKAARRRQRD